MKTINESERERGREREDDAGNLIKSQSKYSVDMLHSHRLDFIFRCIKSSS